MDQNKYEEILVYKDEVTGRNILEGDAELTRYKNGNVKEALDKLMPDNLNGYGVTILSNGANPTDLSKFGLYHSSSWADGSVPLASSHCIVEVIPSDENIVMLKAHYPTSNTIFIKSSYLDGAKKKWFEWSCITEQHTSITFKNGWGGNGQLPLLTQLGDVVWFNAIVRNGTNTIDTVIGTIPADYRPIGNVVAIMQSRDGSGLVVIGDNGDIKITTPVPEISSVQITAMWTK